MRRLMSVVLVMVLLASAVPMAVTPAASIYEVSEKKIPYDADENNELTKEELVNAILPYMLDEGDLKLDDVGDASWVYAYWDGKPKTITDDSEAVLTFYRPIERIVILNHHMYMPLQTIKATDNVVGIESLWFQEKYKQKTPIIYPIFVDLPQVGSGSTPDYEKMMKLQPELVLSTSATIRKRLNELDPDIAVVPLSLYKTYNKTFTVENYRALGYLLDKKEEAEEFIDYYEGFMEMIVEKADRPEEDKLRVYYMSAFTSYYGWKDYKKGDAEMIRAAGGNDIFSDVKGSTVDVEAVIRLDPEVIISQGMYDLGGYGMDDITKLKNLRDEIMSRPELQNVTAVKNKEVYTIPADLCCCGATGGRYFLGVAYFAKCLYPDLDLDPTALHQEFLTRFQGVDYDLSEHGVFVYHPERFPEGR